MVIDNELRSSGDRLNDILKHYGIDGQKWGHRNGPPYPLDPNKDYSKAEKKALRKEYRKEIRRQKKAYKRYQKDEIKRKKEEEEKLKLEEAKKKAIASGNASEIEKFKDKMSNEELTEAINRIKTVQEFDRLKVSELRMSNEKTQEQLNQIIKENELTKQELLKKYGPGKIEAIIGKAARYSSNLATIAESSNKALTALNTAQQLKKKIYDQKKKERDDLRKERDAKEEKLINRVINSGNESLINKHLNKMNNDQLEKAMKRLEILNPDVDNAKRAKEARDKRIEKVIRSGNESLINKHLDEMSNDELESAMKRLEMLNPTKDRKSYAETIRERKVNSILNATGTGNLSLDKAKIINNLGDLSNDDIEKALKRLELTYGSKVTLF